MYVIKRRLYEKFVHLTLMKLTAGNFNREWTNFFGPQNTLTCHVKSIFELSVFQMTGLNLIKETQMKIK